MSLLRLLEPMEEFDISNIDLSQWLPPYRENDIHKKNVKRKHAERNDVDDKYDSPSKALRLTPLTPSERAGQAAERRRQKWKLQKLQEQQKQQGLAGAAPDDKQPMVEDHNVVQQGLAAAAPEGELHPN